MAAGFLDRRRARELMGEAGLDAVVLTQPESIRYAAGDLSRRRDVLAARGSGLSRRPGK